MKCKNCDKEINSTLSLYVNMCAYVTCDNCGKLNAMLYDDENEKWGEQKIFETKKPEKGVFFLDGEMYTFELS